MTVTSRIDPARLLEEQLAQASPDLLRELLTTFVNTLMSAESDAVCGAAYGTMSPDRVNRRNGYRAPELRHPRRDLRAIGAEAAPGHLLPRPAAGASQAGRAGAHERGGDLLPARREHPADGHAGAVAGHHDPVEVAGQRPRSSTPAWSSSARRVDDAGSFTFVALTHWCSRFARAAGWSA
jgi:Transposase, Mutator family